MTLALAVLPVALQAVAIAVDEGWFHRRRGLPRWERIGHPLDTLTIAICLGWLAMASPSMRSLWIYCGLAIFSTLFVTKDEPVHARLCGGGEQWLHAVLYALHPIVLYAFAWLWWHDHHMMIIGILGATVGYALFQTVYWNVVSTRNEPPINNAWYGDLKADWYNATNSPIALLRAEARHRNPWIVDVLSKTYGNRPLRILDLGCGAGLLSNWLAQRGHLVTGIDANLESLQVAQQRDGSGQATYLLGDARSIPCADSSFDVVCAMDLLEHIENPEQVIAEISRVLAPSGVFFFHTFNRTWQSQLVVIKGVEWFVANTPKALHVSRMFVTPEELAQMCRFHKLAIAELRGSRPKFGWPLWRLLFTGSVGDDFQFIFTSSTKLGYTGYARAVAAGPPNASDHSR